MTELAWCRGRSILIGKQDERGYFARSVLPGRVRPEQPSHNISHRTIYPYSSQARHSARNAFSDGPPHPEGKLVRCIGGAVYDVVVDLRRDEPTFCHWIGVELSAENGRSMYIPKVWRMDP